jgi:sulfatase modifying factor 1
MIITFKTNCIITIALTILSASHVLAQDSTFTNSIGMEFIQVRPGSFTMGSFQPPYPKQPAASADKKTISSTGYKVKDYKLAEDLARRDALSGFNVGIKHSFYIGKFEVTQAQWKKVMGSNPSVFQGDKVSDSADDHPVENVTWKDAQQFLNKLNQMEKGMTYRLPTEFEWEYAARAGANDDIPWSKIRETAQLGTSTTNRVGQKKPNAWGLYDMLGNVWEWVQDYYNEKLFADSIPAKTGKVHVLKGASFTGDVKNATYMTHAAGPGNGWDVGFRVVMEQAMGNRQ